MQSLFDGFVDPFGGSPLMSRRPGDLNSRQIARSQRPCPCAGTRARTDAIREFGDPVDELEVPDLSGTYRWPSSATSEKGVGQTRCNFHSMRALAQRSHGCSEVAGTAAPTSDRVHYYRVEAARAGASLEMVKPLLPQELAHWRERLD